MAASQKDMALRIAALEEVVASLAALLVTKEAVSRPEAFRMFMTLIRDIDDKAAPDPAAKRINNTLYRARAPRAVAIEALKNAFMEKS